MSEVHPINRAPCTSCPYRRDVPSGIWASEEYDKIVQFDQETMFQPPAIFLCHQADGCLCRGWLDTHGPGLLALRLACARGTVDHEAVNKAFDEGPAVPVFKTAAQAAKHGRRAINRPGRKAKALADKIETKQLKNKIRISGKIGKKTD